MLKDVNDAITEKLGKEHQIGHSYFMVEHPTTTKLHRIIEYAIMPLIHQYFLGNKEKIMEIEKLLYWTNEQKLDAVSDKEEA